MKLPPDNGLEIYRHIIRIQPNLITTIVAGYAEEMAKLIDQTLDEYAYALLTKAIEIEILVKLLEEVLDAKRSDAIQSQRCGNHDAENHTDSR